MMEMTVPIIIPAYEPESKFVDIVQELIENNLKPVVVVDDGSGREYKKIFSEISGLDGAFVLRHSVNLGKGRGLKSAFNFCLNEYQNIIGCVTADSDGQHKMADIKKCRDALVEEPENLILGCRDFNCSDIPMKSVFGNKLTCHICRFICGLEVSDTQTGLRGIPSDFMKMLLSVPGERFEFETNMLIESKNKFPITEISIETVYDSKDNHKTHFDPIRDSARIYKIFWKKLFLFMVSSLSASIVDIGLFILFCWVFKQASLFWYVPISTVAARIISATYNFFLNYRIVFNSNEKCGKSAVKYLILAVIQMICSASWTTLGTLIFPMRHEAEIKIVVDVILFFFSYVVQREFVFE